MAERPCGTARWWTWDPSPGIWIAPMPDAG